METNLITSSKYILKKEFSPPSRWKRFLSLFSYQDNPKLSVGHDTDTLKKSIVKEVDIIIGLEDYELLIKFLNSGYSLNKDQVNSIILEHPNLWTKVNSSGNFIVDKNELYDFLSTKADWIEDTILARQEEFIDNVNSICQGSEFNLAYLILAQNTISKHKDSFISHIDSQINFFSSFHFLFSNNLEKTHEAIELFQKTSRVFKEQHKWNTNVFDDLNYLNTKCLSHLKNKYKNHSSHIQKKLQQSEMLYLAQSIDSEFNNRIKNKIQNFGPKVVPASSWKLTQDIQKLVTQIDASKLQEINKLNFDNIIKKRLPEIFEDYLGISEEYKTKLRTIDNKSPDDLLLDSLSEVHKIVLKIYEFQQQEQLTRMSVKNKYLKNI